MDKELLNSLDINKITKELRKDSLSIKNRLQSILYDSEFIQSLTHFKDVPIVPNERCGLWYVPTDNIADTSYFKSTDGHTNAWSFSYRRLNFHLLPLFNKAGSIAIVDSTRKGKLMPDALLKTIPIWCAVINNILFENYTDEMIIEELKLSEHDEKDQIADLKANKWLKTPRAMVSLNEHNEIAKRIPGFVQELKKLGLITKDILIEQLKTSKPVIPRWEYPTLTERRRDDSFYFGTEATSVSDPYYTIHCITASKKINKSGHSTVNRRTDLETTTKFTSWYYIQGAADDHELWATNKVCEGKFDPTVFWNLVANGSNEIIDKDTGFIYDWLSDDHLVERINQAYQLAKENKSQEKRITYSLDISEAKNKNHNTNIMFGKIDHNLDYTLFVESYPNIKTLVILSETFTISEKPETSADNDVKKLLIFQYQIESSKKGSKKLREIFPQLIPKLNDLQLKLKISNEKIMILCDSGKDLSTGLVLVILCENFDIDWKALNPDADNITHHVNKDTVKQQLNNLTTVRKVNPSRNTLQSVNTYLM